MKHFAAKLRIHCLKRNINRLQTVLNDPVNILLAHICQSHIISLKKRKSGIVILKIKSFSHSRRHLINKAENTAVGAGAVLIHKPVFKLDPQIFLIFFFHFQFPQLAVCFFNEKCHKFIVHQITIIKNILHRSVIYGSQDISRLKLQFLGNTSRQDPGDDMLLFFHKIPFFRLYRHTLSPAVRTVSCNHHNNFTHKKQLQILYHPGLRCQV